MKKEKLSKGGKAKITKKDGKQFSKTTKRKMVVYSPDTKNKE